MKLIENDISDIIANNYDISIGYVNPEFFNIKSINEGIVKTYDISHADIKRCSLIKLYSANTKYQRSEFVRTTANKIYVCLYSPDNNSFSAPNGNQLDNIILEDNYVWRYICDITQVIKGDYVIPSIPSTERIYKGRVSSIDIILNSGHQITNYASFNTISTHLSGSGLDYVVENNQSTLVISDVLVQNGGSNYDDSDIIAITDTPMLPEHMATVDVFVQDGQVKLESFTNGQNYDHLEIFIIGDGTGSSANYSTLAGVLTNVTIVPGTGYTWAKAVVVNSERYIIGNINTEPFNGYNADLLKYIGPDKYVITANITNVEDEINFYGIHRKNNNINKYVYFDNMFFNETFIPMPDETLSLVIVVG